MQPDIEERISQLEQWSRPALIAEWQKLYKKDPPRFISQQLLIRSIAYKWQEEVYGGLSKKTRQQLAKLIRQYQSNPESLNSERSNIMPGTKLRRLWKGEMHEVTVSGDEYTYQGKTYRSLSEVARGITGARWNGPAFFGLRKNAVSKSARGAV